MKSVRTNAGTNSLRCQLWRRESSLLWPEKRSGIRLLAHCRDSQGQHWSSGFGGYHDTRLDELESEAGPQEQQCRCVLDGPEKEYSPTARRPRSSTTPFCRRSVDCQNWFQWKSVNGAFRPHREWGHMAGGSCAFLHGEANKTFAAVAAAPTAAGTAGTPGTAAGTSAATSSSSSSCSKRLRWGPRWKAPQG